LIARSTSSFFGLRRRQHELAMHWAGSTDIL
jgi:hypothetical protein